MEIEHKIYHSFGVFNCIENGEVRGEMTYSFDESVPDKIMINHTWVDPSMRGKGVGDQLILKAIGFAREKQLKIVPLCPFVVTYFARHTEHADLLA